MWPVTLQVSLIFTTKQTECYYSCVINKDLKVNLPKATHLKKAKLKFETRSFHPH